MNTNKQVVHLPNVARSIEVTVLDRRVRVTLDNAERPYTERVDMILPLSDLEDTELLAMVFELETVKVFRQVLMMLAEATGGAAS